MRALVTGGAGFIGSHIADAVEGQGWQVVILDDLSTGRDENLEGSGAELIKGDVCDREACLAATEGVEVVFHLAAARAVGLSVTDPVTSDRVNTGGTVNLLTAARDNGVRRVIIASSSSVYGGVAPLPTPEDAPLYPKSPYAVSKMASETYCRVFSELYGIETVVLRFFNVYGPRQHPRSPYAAAIPLFVEALLKGDAPTIHGDGLQSRDFTFVEDVVNANLAAAKVPEAAGRPYNIAAGRQHTILDLIAAIQSVLGTEIEPVHTDPRPGDVRASCADASRAEEELGWRAQVGFEDGLRRTIEWLRDQN
ncbi:MAG: LPS biosynthesis protein WbpP [Acidobacteria bacterium]|nr:MAG: LPS biosynthesis protein WbpP [Acidobacteriota bacterium]